MNQTNQTPQQTPRRYMLNTLNAIEDFAARDDKNNTLLMHDYGRNIYEKGQRTGFCLDVRIPGYRGLPINQIHRLVFEVDGKFYSSEMLRIWYDGKDFPFSDIGTGRFDNEWMWKYQDYLRVYIEQAGGIPQGIHHVKYGIALRDHYNTIAFCEKDVTIV